VGVWSGLGNSMIGQPRCLAAGARRSAVSAEAAGDVVLCLVELRGGEDLVGGAGLDELAHVEECRDLGDAGGLRHRVGDHDDAGVFAEVVDQSFDVGGGDGVERRAGLVQSG